MQFRNSSVQHSRRTIQIRPDKSEVSFTRGPTNSAPNIICLLICILIASKIPIQTISLAWLVGDQILNVLFSLLIFESPCRLWLKIEAPGIRGCAGENASGRVWLCILGLWCRLFDLSLQVRLTGAFSPFWKCTRNTHAIDSVAAATTRFQFANATPTRPCEKDKKPGRFSSHENERTTASRWISVDQGPLDVVPPFFLILGNWIKPKMKICKGTSERCSTSLCSAHTLTLLPPAPSWS